MAERQAEDHREDDSAEQPSGWDKLCSEEHLAEIALLVTDWREISPFLGLTAAEEHEILGSAPHSVFHTKDSDAKKVEGEMRSKSNVQAIVQSV